MRLYDKTEISPLIKIFNVLFYREPILRQIVNLQWILSNDRADNMIKIDLKMFQ